MRSPSSELRLPGAPRGPYEPWNSPRGMSDGRIRRSPEPFLIHLAGATAVAKTCDPRAGPVAGVTNTRRHPEARAEFGTATYAAADRRNLTSLANPGKLVATGGIVNPFLNRDLHLGHLLSNGSQQLSARQSASALTYELERCGHSEAKSRIDETDSRRTRPAGI